MTHIVGVILNCLHLILHTLCSSYLTLPDVYLWKRLNGRIFHVPILRNLCYPIENIICVLHKISHDTTQRMSENIKKRFEIWLHHHGSHLKHTLQVSLYSVNIIYVRNKLCSIICIFCKSLKGTNLLEIYFRFFVQTSVGIARLQVCYLLNFGFLLLLHSFLMQPILIQ